MLTRNGLKPHQCQPFPETGRHGTQVIKPLAPVRTVNEFDGSKRRSRRAAVPPQRRRRGARQGGKSSRHRSAARLRGVAAARCNQDDRKGPQQQRHEKEALLNPWQSRDPCQNVRATQEPARSRFDQVRPLPELMTCDCASAGPPPCSVPFSVSITYRVAPGTHIGPFSHNSCDTIRQSGECQPQSASMA